MRINPIVYGFLVLAIFFGVILGFQAAGVWSVSGKVTTSGDAVQPSAADVNTIKGWMTLEQITSTYNVPLAELLAQFELPAETPGATAIKDLESELFSVTNLRTWLQAQMDNGPEQPAESAPQTTLPASTPTTAPTQSQPASAEAPASSATEYTAPEKTVTGKTTFQELLDWGVPNEAIQKAIGGDMPEVSTVIKDYVTGKGLEFPTIKAALQAEVDKVK